MIGRHGTGRNRAQDSVPTSDLTGRTRPRHPRPPRGFTLIELLIVMAIIGTLLAIAVPRYFHSLERARETVLRQDLAIMREALDKYYADRGVYPEELSALVERSYVRAIPVDPFTKLADSWTLVASEDPDHAGVRDIHSGSSEQGSDGTPLASW